MITSEEPRVTLNGRYSIVQTCKALGCCRNTLMKKVREGHLMPEPIGTENRMIFRGDRILQFWRRM